MKMIKRKLIASVILSSLAGSGFAVQQNASVNPANVMNTLDQTLPGAQAPKQGTFQVESQPQTISHAEDSTSTFVLKKVQILGAEHPVPQNVQALYQAMMGKPIDFKGVQALAANMEQTYRDDGYILVQVILPPQEIDLNKGILQLRVVEGQIQNVIFKGDNPQAAEAQLERYADQIEEEDPVTYQTIDRFLTLANNLPGIDVSATLVPNPKIVGASDLIIDVKQTKASAFVNFNNRGTQYIGPGQLAVGGSLYDILGADALSLTEATSASSPKEMQYSSASYDIVVGRYATEINPSVTVTQTTPGNSLAQFDMYGESTKYNLSVNQPLHISTAQNLTLQSSFYRLNSFNSVFTSEQLYNDEITALSLGLDYQGLFLQTYNDINLSTTAGLPVLGTPSTLSNPSIANGATKFIKFNLLTSHIHYFTQKVSMALGSQVQVTPDTMLASEQIGYGGQYFGQAFTPYVISGDNGVMGSIALRYDLPAYGPFSLIQPQVFYDIGAVTLNSPPAGVSNGASAESAGLGLNLQVTSHWQCGLTVAKPLKITQTPGVDMGWNGFINLTGVF